MSSDDSSRRKHPRFDGIIHVGYGDEARPLVKAKTENASLGGLFISTNHPLKSGTRVHVEIFLPNVENSISADCEVVWIRGPGAEQEAGMGVKFVSIDDGDRQRLQIKIQAWPKT